MEEKECEACGKFFTPTHKLQKYCPDCTGNGYRIKQKIDRRVQKRAYEDWYNTPVENTCPVCGKTWLSYPTHRKKYCSEECFYEDTKHTLKCVHCGKPVIEDHVPSLRECHDPAHAFCNEACRQAFLQEQRVRKYGVKTCMNCCKTYSSANEQFCSRACFDEYQKKRRIETGKPPRVPKTKVCKQCGKPFTSTNTTFCSQACSQQYRKEHAKDNKKTCLNCGKTYESNNARFCCRQCQTEYRRAHPEYGPRPSPVERPDEQTAISAKIEEYVKQNGMCGICRTSYMDCERMRSNFTYSPKGSIHKDGKIVSCPKFVPPKKL